MNHPVTHLVPRARALASWLATLLVAVGAAGCGPSTGDYCFAPDAPIATPSGPRLIDELKVGDLVLGQDGQARPVLARPSWASERLLVTLQVAGEPPLAVTPDHTVDTPTGPVRADSLARGDAVLGPGGAVVTLIEVGRRPGAGRVLNLELDDERILAAGIAVRGLTAARTAGPPR